MEVSLDKAPVGEKSGRTIDTPAQHKVKKNSIVIGNTGDNNNYNLQKKNGENDI